MSLIEILPVLAGSALVKNFVEGAIYFLSDQLSSNTPLSSTNSQVKLTAADRRISMGLTKRDGKVTVALLVEKSDSSAEKKAEDLASKFAQGAIPVLTGVAHSSKVDLPSKRKLDHSVGASIGHIRGNPGSIGCFVTLRSRAKQLLGATSAAHVLSMLNRAEKGDPVICPGHPDGPNVLDNKVGTLANFTFLNHYTDQEDWANILNHEDIAVVQLDDPDRWPDRNLVPNPGESARRRRITACVDKAQMLDYLGNKVFKVGRTTDSTVGTFELVAIEQYPIRLPDGRTYMYKDLLAIKGEDSKPFSLPGDSGALVYTEDFKALGFVVGGSDLYTFLCGAEQCLNSIGATLA